MIGLGHNLLSLAVILIGAGLALSSCIALIQSYRLIKIQRTKIFGRKLDEAYHLSPSRKRFKIISPSLTKSENLLPLLLMAAFSLVIAQLEPVNQWGAGPRLGLVIAAIYIGYRVPAMRRERKQAQHRAEIERDLPAMIDLLVVMMEAGSTFDDAILRLVNDPRFPDSAIKQELARLTAELAITPKRQAAFQKFSSTAALNDLRLFSSVLVQSENFGTPISKGLQSLAFEIRERMSHAVEAKGSSLGPKLAIPMTLFFLPLIFIVVLTPTIIRALHLS